MALGAKHVETRSWTTPYRGLLAIHASSRYTMALAQQTQEFAALLRKRRYPFFASVIAGQVDDPDWRLFNPAYCRGQIVCVVNLLAVLPINEAYSRPWSLECEFGDYSLGRYAWHTQLVHTFTKPIRAVGRQQFWEWEVPVEFAGAKWLDTGEAAHERLRGKRTGRSAVGRGS